MTRPYRLMLVVGARPNFMKIAPIVTALQRHPGQLEATLVHTGQHYDAAMSEVFFEQLGLPRPDIDLGVGSNTHARQTADIMTAFEPVVLRWRPDMVVVVGDVNSTIACALVASKLGVGVAHVEAGLRSFDRQMPEETNRILTDRISDLLFVTEQSGIDNLRREGVPDEQVFFVGNVMIDTLLAHRAAATALNVPAQHGLERGAYGILTLHRPSNVDDVRVLVRLFAAIAEIARDLPFVFPVHPRTRPTLEQTDVVSRLVADGRLRLLHPLGYLEFLGLMADSRVVLTDSGGIQEETTVLGVPCLTLRENTERPVTVTEGTNRLVGTDPARILDGWRDLAARRPPRRVPPLWDGRAAERIVDVLIRHSLTGQRAALPAVH
jgi:UDP-N-acetylglucosamine 2-epimerase (non-hydrolysing)